MADYVRANSGGVQAAYTQGSNVQANCAGLQVAYWLEGVASYIQADAAGVQVAYLSIPFNRNRVFPVAPAQRNRQSQGNWSRWFPV